MKRFNLMHTLLLFLATVSFVFAQGKEIIGYYPSWQWYDRDKLVNPQTIPYGKLTIVNYAFFYPLLDGTIVGTDAWADENLLRGQPDWVNGGYLPNTSIIDVAHNNNVKVLLSIGGWTLSSNFPSIAADPVKTQNFAHWCVEHIKDYGFDGIDIDWEYPGYAPHSGTPQDKQNFTIFLQAIRDSLDAHGAVTGRDYMLTAALAASQANVANIEVTNVANILDMLNIMSYDFFGSWNPTSNHNSPLYAPAQGDTGFNIDAAFKLYNQTHGVPGNKINLGVAFYGRSYANCNSLFGSHSGNDAATWPEDEGIPLYYNILAKSGSFTQSWDAQAQSPYSISASYNSFLSYDDEQSIGLRADYVINENAGGVIIWEITGDYMANGDTPLLDVLNNKFNSGNLSPTASITNPANGATFTEGDNIIINATASDADGSIVHVEFFEVGNSLGIDSNSPFSINWNNVAAGSYSLTAVAMDDQGATGTSASVAITVSGGSPSQTTSIKIDQFGYLPDAQKVAVIANPMVGYNAGDTFVPGNTYEVRRVSDQVAVFSGSPIAWNSGATHGQSGDQVWWFDFSVVTTPGEYYLYDSQNNAESYAFNIADDVYDNVLRQAVRTFYYQRCGIAKTTPYAEANWTDVVCHHGTEQDLDCRLVSDTSPGTSKDLSGGWHDAGDYNKYINFADEPVHDLLHAYEENPTIWGDDYGLPESGNGTPDLLDEVKWELDWFLKMQNSDGSVLHKIAAINWNGGSPPSTETTVRRYAVATASATISASATLAHAAIVFKALPDASMQAYGVTLENAAISAWSWLEANPGLIPSNFDNSGFVNADGEDSAYEQSANRVTAAAYLFVLTGDAAYKTYFEANYAGVNLFASSYASPYESTYQSGILYYLKSPQVTGVVKTNIENTYRNAIQFHFTKYINQDDAYRAYLQDHTWGSNRVKCEKGGLFTNSIEYAIDPANDTGYLDAASEYVHYIHGVNPQALAYLSNMSDYGAENFVREIYHLWFTDGSDWDNAETSLFGPAPGIMPGGPNEFYDPPVPPIVPPENQPAQKSYKDWNTVADYSWEINENQVAYQAAYISLLSKFVNTLAVVIPTPAAPTNLTATETGTSTIDLSWDDNSIDENGFKIERKTDGNRFSQIAQTAADAVSYNDTGLNDNTTYTYRVFAFNNSGNSAYSNEASATTEDGGNSEPTADITNPANGAAFNTGDNITIEATANDADGSVTQVEFFESSSSLGIDGSAPYSIIWNNVAAGSYSLTAVATDGNGATGTSGPIAITVNSVGNCNTSPWEANTIYTPPDEVLYNGDKWRAKWWTKGDIPGADEWGPWENLGGCNDGSPIFRVERSTGDVFTDGSFIGDGADLAERINISEQVEPGDVVELDPDKPKHYRKARGSGKLIAGVITTEPGFILGNNSKEMQTSNHKDALNSQRAGKHMLALYALGEPILCDMNWESTGVLHGRLVAGREVNRVDYFCSCRRAVLRAC